MFHIARAKRMRPRPGFAVRTAKIWGEREFAPLRSHCRLFCSLFLAEWTGLEPATPGVTGRYSNQLNYHSSNAAGGC